MRLYTNLTNRTLFVGSYRLPIPAADAAFLSFSASLRAYRLHAAVRLLPQCLLPSDPAARIATLPATSAALRFFCGACVAACSSGCSVSSVAACSSCGSSVAVSFIVASVCSGLFGCDFAVRAFCRRLRLFFRAYGRKLPSLPFPPLSSIALPTVAPQPAARQSPAVLRRSARSLFFHLGSGAFLGVRLLVNALFCRKCARPFFGRFPLLLCAVSFTAFPSFARRQARSVAPQACNKQCSACTAAV